MLKEHTIFINCHFYSPIVTRTGSLENNGTLEKPAEINCRL
ncbi:hypothetical protein HMPREF1548_00261 [Clostridium sp. KLE 1755]|nr:hypothetical protein HMPREF1548_00261 [Clostridium sp. KLE 1755]